MVASDFLVSTQLQGFPWQTEGANQNVSILGTSGSGKSFTAKVMLLREFARGARILALDPEREYCGLAKAAGGSVVDCGGGEGAPISPASDFTVFDIHALTEASDGVRRAQYLNVLGYAWDLVREGQASGRPTLLVVDEAWLLADPQTPQALGFLYRIAKRIRKYGGSLVVITQNVVVDFLAPELARFGQPVIDSASTKILMRQEAKDLEALRDLLRLTEAECDLLSGAKRGEGLLLAGNQRVRLQVRASAREAEIIAGATL